MRLSTRAVAVTLTVPLAACMGGGDEGGIETVTSSGLLSIELPAQSERGAFSQPVQDLITTVEMINEANMVDLTPSGSTTFNGTFGLLFDEDPTVVSGTAAIEVNSASSNALVTLTAQTVENSSFSTVTGSLSGAAGIFSGYYAPAIAGSLTGDGSTTYSLNGSLNGVFSEGGDTIGSFNGTAVNVADPDDSDGFTGIFEASE